MCVLVSPLNIPPSLVQCGSGIFVIVLHRSRQTLFHAFFQVLFRLGKLTVCGALSSYGKGFPACGRAEILFG